MPLSDSHAFAAHILRMSDKGQTRLFGGIGPSDRSCLAS